MRISRILEFLAKRKMNVKLFQNVLVCVCPDVWLLLFSLLYNVLASILVCKKPAKGSFDI